MRSLKQSRRAARSAPPRTCYGHLAGRLGVDITQAMLTRGLIYREGEVFLLTGAGATLLEHLGISNPPRAGKACNDWSERRPHLAGHLGIALAGRLFELGWLQRTPRAREVELRRRARSVSAASSR